MLITVLLAAELLFNPSLDKKNADGKGPEGWTLPKDCRVEYHEIAYLSDNMAVSFQRTSPGLLLEQKLSKKVSGKEGLTCVFDAVFPIEKYPLEWEVKDGVFRLFTRIPVTVQINSVSLKDEVSPLQLNLAPRLKPPKAEGAFPPRRLHVVAKRKSDIRVLMFFAGTDADWCAEDLERQFGFKVDVVANGRTYDPETVQKRFDRGEYVLLRCWGNPAELEKKPDSPIAEYIRRGGRAVYLSPRRGGTYGSPKALPKGIPYDRISPKHLTGYGIACLSEGKFGKGTVVELGLKSPIYRHGIWQAVDEIYHCPELHDFEEKMAGFPYNEFYSLLYADLITDSELETEPFEYVPEKKKNPVRFDSKKRYIVANYMWIAEHYRKEYYDILKEIGINAINCWIPGSYQASQNGFAWTDGWGGVMSSDPFVLHALQEQGIWGGKAYGNDPVKKHWRSGCLSDPKWKPAAVRSFQRYAELCRENPPVNYAITDEMTLSAPWMNYHAKDSEPCRMEHCLKRFREFLKAKYDTIGKLNARWETEYGSFDEVMPALTEEMRAERKAGRHNYAKWLEFRLFMDSVFAEASDTITAAMKEVSDEICTGQPNWTWMTPMAGIDPTKIIPGRTGSQDYGPAAWVRSFKRPDAPLLSWQLYSGSYDDGARSLSKRLWGALNRGATGIMIYAPFQRDDAHKEGFLSTTGLLTERGRHLREALRPLVQGCGDLVNFSERAAMPVTVLYAQAGMGIAWLESDDKLQFDWNTRKNPDGSDYMNWFRTAEQWEKLLDTLRLGWDYTSEPRLAERLKTAKAVVLPECWALSGETRRLLADFRKRGGVVIGDAHTGLFDADGCPWPKEMGDVKLDCSMPRGFRISDEALVEKIRGFFDGHGISAPFEVVKVCDGKPASGISPGLFKLPGAYVLLLTGTAVDGDNVMRGTRARVEQPDTELELRLKRPVYVSDMVSGVAGAEKTQVFRWNPKEKPAALFISDDKPAAPVLESSGIPGGWVARAASPRILHRAVFGADGREIYDLRANSPLTSEWRFDIEIPEGARLVVSDPATGLSTGTSAPGDSDKTTGWRPKERWFGFNLLGMFCSTKMKAGDRRIFGYFPEDRFQWMEEWGFNFARLPLDYRFFIQDGDWMKLDESQLKKLDAAVGYGRKHGIHIQINFHRAPGYCCNPPHEPQSLFRDREPLTAFTNLWGTLARRYKGIPNEELSFDLVNEPAPESFYDATPSNYAVVARAAFAAIRAVDRNRFVMSDGWEWGNKPVMELHPFDHAAGESIHCYSPHGITHYKVFKREYPDECPPWPPQGYTNGVEWLEKNYVSEWRKAIDDKTFLFVGEFGCYQPTVPHATFLAWLEDTLKMCENHGWGWALWNLDGKFGIMDSGRGDCWLEDFCGHKLDRKALDLLIRYVRRSAKRPE